MGNQVDVNILYHRKDALWVDWVEFQLKRRGFLVYKNDFSKGRIKSMPTWLHENSSEHIAAIVVESEEMFASGNTVEEWRQAADVYTGHQIAAFRRRGLSAPTLATTFNSTFIGDTEDRANDAISDFCARMRFRNVDRSKIIAEYEDVTPPIYPGSVPRNWKMPYNEILNFYGRSKELSDIEKRITKSHAFAINSKVVGRGFGSTSTLAKALYQTLGKFSTVWWISAFDDSQLIDGLKELGSRFGLQGLSGNLAESFPKIHHAIISKVKLPYVIVLERPKHATMQEFENLAENKWTGGCVVALDAEVKRDVLEEVRLDLMNREDAQDMMIGLARIGNVGVLEDITAFLKFHPLLVAMAAGLIKNGRKAETLIDDFQLESSLVQLEKSYLKPFAILSRFVIDQLSFTNPDVEQLLNFAAYFAPLPIPACIFEKPDNVVIGNDLFNRIIYDPQRLAAGLNKLAEYGMINISGSSLVMHPLISQSVTSMPEFRKDWPQRITQMLSERLSPDLPADLLEERRSQIYPHMVDICTNVIRSGSITPSVVALINNVANQAKSLQNWPLATELLIGLRDYFIRTQGDNSLELANIYASLGVIYKIQDNLFDAKHNFENSLRIDTNRLGPNDSSTADDYCQLARIFEMENNLTQSIDYFSRAAEIIGANHGRDHPKYARILSELIAVMKKNNQKSEIYNYAKTVVTIEKKAYGADSPKIVHSMVNVGFAAVERGFYDEALQNFNEGLAIESKVYGYGHIRTAKMLVLIGNVLERKGDEAAALAKYQEALPIFDGALGNHPTTNAVRECIARVS